MINEEGIDETKIAMKVNFKKYGLLFVFVVRFSTTCVIEG